MACNLSLMKAITDCGKLAKVWTPVAIQVSGIKYFAPPTDYSHIILPEKAKLPLLPKVPPLPIGIKPPKMQKNLKFMKGPEEIHNKYIHEQYGIISLTGGRLRSCHFEMMRLTLNRKIDQKRMFLVYRVDSPWQPVTKKGVGQRMGGGKGSIDHYVTPIRARRVIVELGGRCDYEEVEDMLQKVAAKLPFKAMAANHKMLQEMEEKEKLDEARNLNEYTMEYIIKNNLGFARRWCRRNDYLYFGKYI